MEKKVKPYDWKGKLRLAHLRFRRNFGIMPNAVEVTIEMVGYKEGDFDTPCFDGYILFQGKDEVNGKSIDDYNNAYCDSWEVRYYSSSLESFIKDVENGDTDFKVVNVGKCLRFNRDEHYLQTNPSLND